MSKISEAIKILKALGLTAQQQNERTGYALLALCGLQLNSDWSETTDHPLGTSQAMDYVPDNFGKVYKENSRENFRDESITPMVLAGMLIKNFDDPSRPKNSSKNNYRLEPSALELLKTFDTIEWDENLKAYLAQKQTLVQKYAKAREMAQVPITYNDGKSITISPGDHSLLIKGIIEDFGPRFAPGAELLYVGDTGRKWGVYEERDFKALGLDFTKTTNMPDVVLYDKKRNWLLLIESVTSNGPMHGQRHAELAKLFEKSTATLVYVTAFPSRQTMRKFLTELSWETEVWCADTPDHLIHFNGDKFLGPYKKGN